MLFVLEFTDTDLDRPPSEPEKIAGTVREMFDGKTPVRTRDVAGKLGRNFGAVNTHLRRAVRLGCLNAYRARSGCQRSKPFMSGIKPAGTNPVPKGVAELTDRMVILEQRLLEP